MRVLVTGAGGMLGQDVVSAARLRGHDVHAYLRAELDVTDGDVVAATFAQARPEAVVHCAAWTDVDGAETDQVGARAVNATGARNVAQAAARGDARLVHVSTDYVFAGDRPATAAPYVESDATGPHSVYGATKLLGEQRVAETGGSHAIVRSSWLFGTGGRNFVATMLALGAERDEVSVVTDQIGCPTSTEHLADALVTIAEGEAQGVMHVAGGGRCSWNELAAETFLRAGIDCRVLPCTTADMARPAPRPAFSAIRSERSDTPVLPPWQDGLANYLHARKVTHA